MLNSNLMADSDGADNFVPSNSNQGDSETTSGNFTDGLTNTPLKPFRWRSLRWSLVAFIVAMMIIPFAQPFFNVFYRLIKHLPLSSEFSALVQLPSATVVVGTILIIWKLDKKNRSAVPFLLAGLLLAGLANSVIKETAGRTRPQWSVILDQDRRSSIKEYIKENVGTPIRLWKTDHWLWFTPGRPYFSDRYESFPSGHACGVFALAAFLTVLYDPAKWIWLIAAAGCATARVRFRRHYPEDVLVGGALGWSCAMIAFSWHWPRRAGYFLAGFAEKYKRRS